MTTAREAIREEFNDHQARHDYAEIFLYSSIALQIKALRLQRGWSQEKLAELSGMRQSRISAMEQASYSSWSISTLRRLAKAFDLALLVRIESFGNFLDEVVLSKNLQRPSFSDDPVFEGQDRNSTVSIASSVADVVRMDDYRAIQPPGSENRSISQAQVFSASLTGAGAYG